MKRNLLNRKYLWWRLWRHHEHLTWPKHVWQSNLSECLLNFSSEDTTKIFSCSCFSLVCKCKLKLKRRLFQLKIFVLEVVTTPIKLTRHMFVLKCFHLKTQPKYFYGFNFSLVRKCNLKLKQDLLQRKIFVMEVVTTPWTFDNPIEVGETHVCLKMFSLKDIMFLVWSAN